MTRLSVRRAVGRVLKIAGLSILAVAAVTLLMACAGQQTVTIPREVRVPVPIACVKPEDRPKRPRLRTEAEILALDDYKRTLAMWEERRTRDAYEAVLEALIEGCGRVEGRALPVLMVPG